MQISGSYFPPSPYSGADLTGSQPQQSANQPPPAQTATPAVAQAHKTETGWDENRQRRFYSLDRDMNHSARQAINNYRDSDMAGGAELMSRVDVYA